MSASEAARAAARQLAGDLVLAAGAGTGKTHTLVDVVVHLVAGTTTLGRRVPPARILALTFSDKAAAELRERVRARCVELARAPDSDPALVQAYARTAMPPLGGDEWRAAAGAVSQAPIATFHSFAAAVLRRHAAAAGLDPAFTLLEDHEARHLRREAAEATALGALEQPEAHALVRELDFSNDDGFGRGLVEHVMELGARLGEEGRTAAELAGALDDDAAAAREYREAVAGFRQAFVAYDGVLGAGTPSPTEGSKRRWLDAQRRGEILRSLELLVPGIDPEADLVLQEARSELTGLNWGAKSGPLFELKNELRRAWAALVQAHASARSAPLARALLPLVDAAEAAYRAEKARRAALDFTDLLRRTRDLLERHAGARAETQARFDAVLVDEFQDTNPLQAQLLELCRGPGVPRLVVGDPKQSIYEFRGADVTVFGAIARATGERGGQVLALTESRRGVAPLVRFVNRLFAEVMRGDPGGAAFDIQFDPARDALEPVRGGEGRAVTLIELDEDDDEAAAVARQVRRLAEGGRPWRDLVILLRRFTRLDEYLRALRGAGVPHYVVGGRGFHEVQEIRDLAHALVLLDEPDDALALLGVLRSPLVGLSDASLVALAELAPPRAHGRPGRLSLRPLLARGFAMPAALPPAEAARLADFLALYGRLRRHADRLGMGGVCRALVEATDLPAVLAAMAYGEQRIANLEQLIAQADAHDARGLPRAAFVRRLKADVERERSLDAQAQVLGERDDVVRLMTVHQAKGLEFPVVLVPECGVTLKDDWSQVAYDPLAGLGVRTRDATGALTHSRRSQAVAELRSARRRAESKRLFYVACTRARDQLVLSGASRKDSWRRWVEDWQAADAREARALMTCVGKDGVEKVAPAPEAAEPTRPAAAGADTAEAAELAALLGQGGLPALAGKNGKAPAKRKTRPTPPQPAATLTVVPAPAEAAAAREPFELAPVELPAPPPAEPHDPAWAALAERFAAPPRTPTVIVAPVTELADFDACPRRFRLRHEVGLDEHVAGGSEPRRLPVLAEAGAGEGGGAGAPMFDARERGTRAHRVLERLDFAAGAAGVDALIAAAGGPDDPDLRDLLVRFLGTPLGRALAARAPGELAREEAFAFAPRVAAPGGARLVLTGQMDLVLFDRDAITVLDYKLARSSGAHDYRFQLAAYAAAARALWGHERVIRAGLIFLRDAHPEPRLADFAAAELDATEARLAQLAVELADARRTDQFLGRPRPTCEALACGYVTRCHGSAPPPLPPSRKTAKNQLSLF